MSDAAAFVGNYADIVTRKTRSVFVVSVELPIERYQAFVAVFGGPLPGKEIPVALALLDPKAAASAARADAGEPPAKERRKLAEMQLSQQAALRCGDPLFWKYLDTLGYPGAPVRSESDAAELVRRFCAVDSRSGIKPGTQAGAQWEFLDRKFLEWKHGAPVGEPVR